MTTRHSARRWTTLLALAGALAAGTAAAAQTPVPMEFPPPGTRWINRSVDPSGGNQLITYTVLEPGSFRSQAGFRISDGVGVQFYERTGRNWFATVVGEKERAGTTPHSGTFAWPLEVGKTWTSVYQYRDNVRNLRFSRTTTTWRVAAEEELTVPAGAYKTLRLEGENNGNRWTTWYAPALRLAIKEIHERKPGHPSGPGRIVTEVMRHAGPMRAFYDGLAKADTGLALQAAQRAAMKEFPHPFAWAAFGLTGVGR